MEKELLQNYIFLRNRLEHLDEQLKKTKADLEIAVTKLHEDLSQRGAMKTAVYDGLGSYAMGEPTLYASVDKEKEEDLFEYLRKSERQDLIRPSVHHRSLASFVKEALDNGDEIPEFIKTYYKPTGRFYSDKGE